MTKSTAEERAELSDIQIQEEAEEGKAGGIELDSKSSTSAGPRGPRRGCGIQMWPGKVGGEGRQDGGVGEVCSQLALMLCDDIETVGTHESGVLRTCLSEQPGD